MRRGFTLIELMISCALVLVLMLGVNYIFDSVGKATSATQALSRITRDAQAAQAVMAKDLGTISLKDGAPLIIWSQRTAAFRDRQDELGDADYVLGTSGDVLDLAMRTTDLDGNGLENDAADEIPRTHYGRRNFRLDQISFFARGMFRRQTGNDGTYVSDMATNEAWIWYGHLKLPDASGALNAHRAPGADIANGGSFSFSINPNNFYARQWILGRNVMCLAPLVDKPPNAVDGPAGTQSIWDNQGAPQHQVYIRRPVPDPTNTSLAPLEQVASKSSDGSGKEIQWARYDLAGTTIEQFKGILNTAITRGPVGPAEMFKWWNGSTLGYRFQGNPLPDRPITSEGAARTAPILLEHCSQFIVEYAGDFLKQETNPASANFGRVEDTYVRYDPSLKDELGNDLNIDSPKHWSAGTTDGEIDFSVAPDKSRRIRWYGYPRDADGDGAISSASISDVVPLRDLWRQSVYAPLPQGSYFAPFERMWPTTVADYGAPGNVVSLSRPYQCAWGPSETVRPMLIRFIFILEDPNGRLAEGQSFEFVFRVQ